MTFVTNRAYKAKLIFEQMDDTDSVDEFVQRFRDSFPVVWYRLQYLYDMDQKDKTKRPREKIPEPRVYLEQIYNQELGKYKKTMT